MSKASEKHKEIREQNKANLIGLYVFTGTLLLALVLSILSIVF